MKLKIRLIYIIFMSIISHHAIADNTEIPMGTYEYVYEYNTKDLIENHYIKIFMKNDNIYGEYFGTSDDFDSAREGYLPGFFSTQMMNIQANGKSISFSIKPSNFFKSSVTPSSKNTNNLPWDVAIKVKKRTYQGVYNNNKFIINSTDLDPRIFIKIK